MISITALICNVIFLGITATTFAKFRSLSVHEIQSLQLDRAVEEYRDSDFRSRWDSFQKDVCITLISQFIAIPNERVHYNECKF